MPRLRRADCTAPGISRHLRDGGDDAGFDYTSPAGEPLTDPATVERVEALVIPPAWQDVWISPWPNGHIQAIGTDAAGRRQYRYHEQWRLQRDKAKHDGVLEFGERLPAAREQMREHLALPGLPRLRVLACAARLLDLGFFRIGSEEYAEKHGTYGLATIRRDQVTISGGQVTFDYIAKHQKQAVWSLAEESVLEVVGTLKRRRGGGEELLAYKADGDWVDVKSADINAYLHEVLDLEFSAKYFRTWSATVLAAVGLAVSENSVTSPTAAKRAVTRVVTEVSGYLGNTPAVCRSSYIDPRVIDLFYDGITISSDLDALGADAGYGEPAVQGGIEAAVVDLLRGTTQRQRAIRLPRAVRKQLARAG